MGDIDSNKTNKLAVQGTLSQRAWNNGDKGGEMEGEVQKSASMGPLRFTNWRSKVGPYEKERKFHPCSMLQSHWSIASLCSARIVVV